MLLFSSIARARGKSSCPLSESEERRPGNPQSHARNQGQKRSIIAAPETDLQLQALAAGGLVSVLR